MWNFETIRGSLMRPKWLKLASLTKKICKLNTFNSLVYSLLPNDNRLKSIIEPVHVISNNVAF